MTLLQGLKELIREVIAKNPGIFKPQDGKIQVRGLGKFGDSVMFAVPDDETGYLRQVHQQIRQMLEQKRIWTQSRQFNPHVTLFNTLNAGNLNIAQEDLGNDTVF